MNVKLEETDSTVGAASQGYEGTRECWESFLVEKSIERFGEEREDRLQHCQHCEDSPDLVGRNQFWDAAPGDGGDGPVERVEDIAEVENPLTGVEDLEEDPSCGGGEGQQNYCCVLDL